MENVAKICLPTLTLPELTRGIELLETGFTKIKACRALVLMKLLLFWRWSNIIFLANPHTNEEKQIVALTEVVIPVISDSFCKKMFEPLGYTSERMICGGSNNRKFIAVR